MPYHKGLLPREGFAGDAVLGILGRTVFNPSALLGLLLLARYTKRGRDLSVLHETSYRRVHKLLYFALALKVSGWLSQRALNNGRKDKYDWSREIVLVTGGSAGIGAEMVKMLDEQGIKVVVMDVQPLSFRASGNVHYFPCDIRSPEKVQAAAAAIRTKVGNPTVLINNAGVARGKSVLDATPGDIRFTFDVNTLAHYWLAQAFLPSMVKANHGMIVTVASAASWISAANLVDYSASKAAALSFHEGLSAELPTVYGADRVRTVVVHPAHIKTALFKGFDQHRSFLMPSLHPQTVAEAVVRQVISGQSGQVVLPQTVRFAQLIRVLPFWISHKQRIDSSKFMDKWDGRQVIKDVDADVDAEGSESTVLVDKS